MAIAFIGDLVQFLAGNIGALLGGVTSALTAVIGWVGLKYLAPLLQVGKRRQYAQWIALIADEVTDALVARYPNNRWVERINEAVDDLCNATGINTDISRRAVDAALSRKGRPVG